MDIAPGEEMVLTTLLFASIAGEPWINNATQLLICLHKIYPQDSDFYLPNITAITILF